MPAIRKRQRLRGVVLECRWIGDVVLELLTNRGQQDIAAKLHVVPAEIGGEARIGVAARQLSILRDDHGRRKWIRVERGPDLFGHAMDVDNDLRSDDPAPAALPEQFFAVPLLTL